MATGLRTLLGMLLLSATSLCAAESLPDPTRPAIDLSGGTGGAAEVESAEAVPQGLQSIIISPQYRAAIINGETVRLGGKTGDSRLIEVRENSVVLQNSQGRRVMELFPKVGIRKNAVVQQKSPVRDGASEQPSLPEKAVEESK